MLSQALAETRWHPLIDKCLRVEQLDSRVTGKSRTYSIEKLLIDGELSKCVKACCMYGGNPFQLVTTVTRLSLKFNFLTLLSKRNVLARSSLPTSKEYCTISINAA